MSTDKTGGPAFPFIDSASPLEHPGMTLRDYFAAKAMRLTQWNYMTQKDGKTVADPFSAEYCYKIADAMLKARKVNND